LEYTNKTNKSFVKNATFIVAVECVRLLSGVVAMAAAAAAVTVVMLINCTRNRSHGDSHFICMVCHSSISRTFNSAFSLLFF